MFSKEAIKDAALAGGASPFVAGLVGGAGGGVSQVCAWSPGSDPKIIFQERIMYMYM